MGKKILLADDSITIQKVIELTFSDEDFEVITVGNGRLAVEKVQEARPDLVLCDIIMPEKDGYEVCDFIKKNPATAQIPVLLLTGAFEPFDQERANRVGCDGFLAKPFEPQTLIAKVKELLSQAGSRPAPSRLAAPAMSASAPAYSPLPAPSYSPPAAAPPPAPSPPSGPSPAAFVPEEPPDLYGAVDAADDTMVSVAPVTSDESATLREPTHATPESDFSPWAQPTIEVPLETRAQASVESAQEEPVFEEVFEEEPAKAAPAPSPTATASYSFGSSEEEDTGTRAFNVSELPPSRPAPVLPPPAAPVPVRPAPPSSFADVNPPAVAAAIPAASSIAAEVGVPKDMVETIAQRVVAQISEKVVREIAWEVIPDLAEALIKQEIERLKAELQRT